MRERLKEEREIVGGFEQKLGKSPRKLRESQALASLFSLPILFCSRKDSKPYFSSLSYFKSMPVPHIIREESYELVQSAPPPLLGFSSWKYDTKLGNANIHSRAAKEAFVLLSQNEAQLNMPGNNLSKIERKNDFPLLDIVKCISNSFGV